MLNTSTSLTDAAVKKDMSAFQKYADLVEAAWGVHATLYFGPIQNPTDWQIVINDTSDGGKGVLGYHTRDLTGKPVAQVSYLTAASYKIAWTTVFTHEEGEMMVDALAASMVSVDQLLQHSTFVAQEIGDPVESASFLLNKVYVSDFVYPAWFKPEIIGGIGGKYDYLNKVKAPLTLLAGGYEIVYTNDTWQEVFAQGRRVWTDKL